MKIILPEDDNAASIQTVTGWVCSRGFFHGQDERAARYSGSTHRKCEHCEKIIEKRGYCQPCHNKKQYEKHSKKEFKVWDLKEPVVIPNTDEYFFNLDDFFIYCDVNGIEPEEVELSICQPVIAKEIDEEYYADDLAEDHYLEDSAPELADKIAELNKFIYEKQFKLSWREGKFRTRYTKPKT